MTRQIFGGKVSDVIYTSAEGVVTEPNVAVDVTFWSDETSLTTQITDLTDMFNNPITSVNTDTTGQLPQFMGPAAGTTWMWADANGGAGPRAVVNSYSNAPWSQLAATAFAGYTLINGTGTILSWTAPNDGVMHRVLVMGTMHVSSAETGGTINLGVTLPDGTAGTFALFTAGQGGGAHNMSFETYLVAPNTTVTITQASALTAGVAKAWFELWGS